MAKYGLHGKLIAKLGLRDDLVAILLEAGKLVMAECNCELYLVSKNTGDKQTIWVTEVWRDKKDHDESLNNAAVLALIQRALPILAEQPSGGMELEVMGGLPSKDIFK
jgi:quinol monooxygenase YgiN